MARTAPTGRAWVRQWLDRFGTSNSTILRRKRSSIDRYASLQNVIDEVNRRGLHAFSLGDQICVTAAPISILA